MRGTPAPQPSSRPAPPAPTRLPPAPTRRLHPARAGPGPAPAPPASRWAPRHVTKCRLRWDGWTLAGRRARPRNGCNQWGGALRDEVCIAVAWRRARRGERPVGSEPLSDACSAGHDQPPRSVQPGRHPSRQGRPRRTARSTSVAAGELGEAGKLRLNSLQRLLATLA